MKKNYQILYFCLLAIIFSSCFTQKPVYDLKMNSVNKTSNYNKSIVNKDTIFFEDSIVKITLWLNEMNELFVVEIKNKTENPILTKWENAIIITNSDTSKVISMHEDSLEDSFYKNVTDQANDTIYSWKKDYLVYPYKNIYWHNQTFQSGSWKIKELITYPNQKIQINIPIIYNNEEIVYSINFTSEFLKYKNVYDREQTQQFFNTMGILLNSAYLITYLIIFL